MNDHDSFITDRVPEADPELPEVDGSFSSTTARAGVGQEQGATAEAVAEAQNLATSETLAMILFRRLESTDHQIGATAFNIKSLVEVVEMGLILIGVKSIEVGIVLLPLKPINH